jgi:hypothetical protein
VKVPAGRAGNDDSLTLLDTCRHWVARATRSVACGGPAVRMCPLLMIAVSSLRGYALSSKPSCRQFDLDQAIGGENVYDLINF